MKNVSPFHISIQNILLVCMIVLMGQVLPGCGSRSKKNTEKAQSKNAATTPVKEKNDGKSNRDDSRVIAIIGGKPLQESRLVPLMMETIGGDVLYEIVQDEMIARELVKRDLAVSEEDVRKERELALQLFSDDPDQAIRMMDEWRRRNGLGTRRFEMFLQRSASLRRLVSNQVVVTDEMVKQSWEQQKATQTSCRIIVVPNLVTANAMIERMKAGESFIDLAIAHSTDSSRFQGGMLPPIAPWDSSFPTAITRTADSLQPGETSDPIAVENGIAILHCERKITPVSKPFEEAADTLRTELRQTLERTMMDRMARTLLSGVDITILDATLDKSFKERRAPSLKP